MDTSSNDVASNDVASNDVASNDVASNDVASGDGSHGDGSPTPPLVRPSFNITDRIPTTRSELPSGQAVRLDALAREIAGRFRRGERPELEDYQARHPDLRDELVKLFDCTVGLNAHARGNTGAPASHLGPLVRLGDYRIIREIGRGGMGVVYEAEQISLHRRVALKVLGGPQIGATGAASIAARDRFRREARAAGTLHHTNIVPVFDVGEEAGASYYAMQFINGFGLDALVAHWNDTAPLDASVFVYNSNRLTPNDTAPIGEPAPAFLSQALSYKDHPRRIEAIVELGRQAAGALAYAHARGILHRDIKPSNLMLDGAGVVWITDFGLAKRFDESLTQPGEIVGTFRYMAPERFQGKDDPRADIFALGATLYEMLTLKPAFSGLGGVNPKGASVVDPPRPSLLNPAVSRDLDAVVLKAIAQDPADRYADAAALKEDLRRIQAGESILAKSAGLFDRVKRWVKREPRLAAMAAVTLLLLAVLLAGSLAAAVQFADQAKRERELAQEAEVARKEAVAERERAAKETEAVQEIAMFLMGVLEDNDPFNLNGGPFARSRVAKDGEAARAMLVRIRKKLDQATTLRPLVRAALLDKLGVVYVTLGDMESATKPLKESFDLRKDHLPSDDSDMAASWDHQGFLLFASGQGLEAKKLLDKAVAIYRRNGDERGLAESLLKSGIVYYREFDVAAGIALANEALLLGRKHFGAKSRQVAYGLVVLLQMHIQNGDTAAAAVLADDTIKLFEEYEGTKGLSSAWSKYMNGMLAWRLGRREFGGKMCNDAILEGEKLIGPNHFIVLMGRRELATRIHNDLKDLPRAEAEYRKVLDAELSVGPQDSLGVANARMFLARVLRDQKRWDEAETLLKQALPVFARWKASERARCNHILHEVLLKTGRIEESVPYLEETVRVRSLDTDPDRLWLGYAIDQLADLHLNLNRPAEAIRVLRDATPAMELQLRKNRYFHTYQAGRWARLASLLPANSPDRRAAVLKAQASLRSALAAGASPKEFVGTYLGPIQQAPETRAMLEEAAAKRAR